MIRFGAVIGAVALLGMAAGVRSESASAATKHGCHLRRATVVKSTREAVIFRRKDPRLIHGVFYGCYRGRGAIYRLNGRFESTLEEVEVLRLAGRYVGYLEFDEGPTGDDWLMIIKVRDLVTGVVTQASQNGESTLSRNVQSFVLSRRGSAAWITKDNSDFDDPVRPWEYQVLVVDQRTAADLDAGRSGQAHVLARGQDIEPRSLLLARDGRTLSWVKAGTRQSALLN